MQAVRPSKNVLIELHITTKFIIKDCNILASVCKLTKATITLNSNRPQIIVIPDIAEALIN